MGNKKQRNKTLKEMGFKPLPGRPKTTTLDDLVQKMQAGKHDPSQYSKSDYPSPAADDGLSRKTSSGFETYYDGK